MPTNEFSTYEVESHKLWHVRISLIHHVYPGTRLHNSTERDDEKMNIKKVYNFNPHKNGRRMVETMDTFT